MRYHLDIRIEVPTPTSSGGTRVWEAAWNARTDLTAPDGTVLAPKSQLWASHTGGHQQIGCIYTAQGLEFHHAGVIVGPDLTWNHDRWTGHPERSRDKERRGLPPEQYLRYALNIYRVLLTRGTHTTRIHSIDRKPSATSTPSSAQEAGRRVDHLSGVASRDTHLGLELRLGHLDVRPRFPLRFLLVNTGRPDL
ncbi:DNA/RNA helicase domain-containing protein [Streptomyces sp. CS147]|uniref:DNA/RNA helicase domain-containing protein n=1 Tax=Streptomyces sp. CS147 TaxID=2162715 RepID=UPI0013A5B31E|nr:DNA/RNA helicase domain-containing protein [Streptomyces sp. CS147]